jgi:hypothetical protein
MLGARCSLLGTRYSVLVARCSLLAARCSLLDARCSLLGARCSVLGARCSVLGTRCSVFGATYRQYSLPIHAGPCDEGRLRARLRAHHRHPFHGYGEDRCATVFVIKRVLARGRSYSNLGTLACYQSYQCMAQIGELSKDLVALFSYKTSPK